MSDLSLEKLDAVCAAIETATNGAGNQAHA
jgi:hypothetical protein